MHISSPPTPHADSTRLRTERALVLGGGGSTGNAGLIGLRAGLFDAGLDVTAADVTIGTSAGATAAAQVAGATPAALFAAIVEAGRQQPRGTTPLARGGVPDGPVTDHLDRVAAIIASASDAVDMRRGMGAAALDLEAASDGSWPTRWRDTVEARLPSRRWPERAMLITAVDARTGEPVVFDRFSGIELVDAVAASCSSGLPYPVGQVRYIDGGYRRNENADLAIGVRRVLVLSPFGGTTLHPLEWGVHLAAQVDELRAGGSEVVTVVPDAASEHLFGANAMNPALRGPAARAGYDQATSLAPPLTEFWR